MSDATLKVCTKCEEELPLSEFHKAQSGKCGVRAQCKSCSAAYKRDYREKHGDAIRERERAYYRENSEACVERRRKWRESNREHISEYSKGYYWLNRDVRIRQMREYREAHPELFAELGRKYRQDNPEMRREAQERRRARLRGATVVRFTQDELSARMAYFANKCWMCGGPFENVDHVKPISRGGPHMLSNLRPSCCGCNSSKGAKWPLEELNFK